MHPKVLQAYREANYDIPPSVAENTARNFKEKTQNAIKERRIDQIYRVKVAAEGRDYIWFRVTDIAEDFIGNSWTWEHEIGRYEMPKFSRQFNQATQMPVVTGIEGHTMVYEIPFSVGNMKAILDTASIQSNIHLVLHDGVRKYSGPFSPQDFFTRHFDDLMEKCTSDDHKFPAVPTPVESDRDVAIYMYKKKKMEEQLAQRNKMLFMQRRGLKPLLAKPIKYQDVDLPEEQAFEERQKKSVAEEEMQKLYVAPTQGRQGRQNANVLVEQEGSNFKVDATEVDDLSDIPNEILDSLIAVNPKPPTATTPPGPKSKATKAAEESIVQTIERQASESEAQEAARAKAESDDEEEETATAGSQ